MSSSNSLDHIGVIECVETNESTNECFTTDDEMGSCFVAVHIGAGFHSQSKTPTYKLLCEKICSSVIKMLNKGSSARKAAAFAVALLENSPMTNAGLGSNLTLDEKIECDASIMDLNGFGSVGAISNIKNPIMVSLTLLEAQLKGTLPMGRIVPCMLVGEGARIWAREHNLEEVTDDFLKTENMVKSHDHYMKKLNLLSSDFKTKSSNLPSLSFSQKASFNEPNEILNSGKKNEDEEEKKLDTVGAIVLDYKGNFASAVSSGGILLKHPGRVGHASMFGCGCWVQNEQEEVDDHDNEKAYLDKKQKHSVAICTTGCGEYIIKTLFARECAEHILKNKDETEFNLTDFYKKKFFNSPLLKNYPDKLIGAMICKLDASVEEDNSISNKSLDLIVSHSTPSMCFGYISSKMAKPVSVMSRLENNMPKDSVCITNFHMDLSTPSNSQFNVKSDDLNGTKKQRLS